MGLMEKLNAETGSQMTPGKAFLISMLYMISVDGEIDSEEVGHLLSILGGSKERGPLGAELVKTPALERALEYRSKHSVDNFLKEIAPILNTEQQRFILLNLADSALSDGQLETAEKELLNKFLTAFNLNWHDFNRYFEVLAIKSSRGVLFKR